MPTAWWETMSTFSSKNPVRPSLKSWSAYPHLVTSLREYRWSSWLEYIGQEKNAFCATNVVLSRISLEELSNLIAEPLAEKEEEGLLDIEEAPVKTCYSDEEIWHVLTNLCGMTTAAEFQQLPRPQQKHYLWEAHEKGIGPRALSRLTGRTIFHRAKGNKCRKWEKTPVGNGMWIYPWRRRLVFLLLTWWIRALPGVLISLRQKRIRDLSPDPFTDITSVRHILIKTILIENYWWICSWY